MAQCQIQKCKTDDSDLQKINALARRELSADEIYVFNVTLCSNEVDRDYEKFSIESLKQLAPLFIGKTGISDHSMKSSDQKARIFDTYIEKQDGRFTVDGEPLCCLKAKAYMLNNEKNASLIEEIDAGIKKEVSVSCSMSSSKCSVCGNDRKRADVLILGVGSITANFALILFQTPPTHTNSALLPYRRREKQASQNPLNSHRRKICRIF
ncbi:MAG: hypothetical protein ACLRW3_00490 [Eubacterium sp.]